MKSKLAVVSFVLSILGLIIFLIYVLDIYILNRLQIIFFLLYTISIISALVTSIISLKIIKKKKLEGRWIANSSLIISLILICITIIVFLCAISDAFIGKSGITLD